MRAARIEGDERVELSQSDKAGQVVRGAIAGIGELVNECVPERPST